MKKRLLILCLILLAGCVTNPAVIKPDKNKGIPFSTNVYLNGWTVNPAHPPAAPSVTTGEFTDERDNQVYKWVKIGTQTWMAQNLNYKTATNSWVYNTDDHHNLYGRLYSFDVLLQACPKGWHVPTDTEWMQLEKYLCLKYDEAGLLGSRGDIADKLLPGNSNGFNILYGGWYNNNNFTGIGKSAYFWTSTGYGQPIAIRVFKKGKQGIYRNTINREAGLSLRCVKDYW